jgi:hypothetical protein
MLSQIFRVSVSSIVPAESTGQIAGTECPSYSAKVSSPTSLLS